MSQDEFLKSLNLDNFPSTSFDKIRYGDTDRQGHVNNALFASFIETGRVEILINDKLPVLTEKKSFVIASLNLDLVGEIKWPGRVDIGTGILKIGNSSITLFQKLFQNGTEVAQAKTTIVQIDDETKKSSPLSEDSKNILGRWLLKD